MDRGGQSVPADRSHYAWTVIRQDDNGNRFVMEKGLTRDLALQMVAQFERRGHKQVYWAEPEGDRSTETTAE